MANFILTQANKLNEELAAIIALPGNKVRTAIFIYGDFSDTQREHALSNRVDLLEKAIELQNTLRNYQYICDEWQSDFKLSLRYLGIDEDEVIKDDELLIIFNNVMKRKEEELKDWLNY